MTTQTEVVPIEIKKEELYKGFRSIEVLIIGESGRGKSTSLQNLPCETTSIINVMGKPLPFIGAPAKYKLGHNLFTPDPMNVANSILSKMEEISMRRMEMQHIAIDDIQYVMAMEFMDKVMVKGYDKFSIMAKNMWNILVAGSRLRDGMKVFLLAHEENIGGATPVRKMKTLGKLLDEKITPEGLSTIVLFSDVIGEGDNRQYYFQTQSDGICSAKSPAGMFPMFIPNDLWLVSQRIDEYYAGVPLSDTKLHFEAIQGKPKSIR